MEITQKSSDCLYKITGARSQPKALDLRSPNIHIRRMYTLVRVFFFVKGRQLLRLQIAFLYTMPLFKRVCSKKERTCSKEANFVVSLRVDPQWCRKEKVLQGCLPCKCISLHWFFLWWADIFWQSSLSSCRSWDNK